MTNIQIAHEGANILESDPLARMVGPRHLLLFALIRKAAGPENWPTSCFGSRLCKNKNAYSICAKNRYLAACAGTVFSASKASSYELCEAFTFLHIDGRPHFAKLSIGDIEQVKIAAIDPDL
jgi:hypothetical protein